jgi:hypothetical protein
MSCWYDVQGFLRCQKTQSRITEQFENEPPYNYEYITDPPLYDDRSTTLTYPVAQGSDVRLSEHKQYCPKACTSAGYLVPEHDGYDSTSRTCVCLKPQTRTCKQLYKINMNTVFDDNITQVLNKDCMDKCNLEAKLPVSNINNNTCVCCSQYEQR